MAAVLQHRGHGAKRDNVAAAAAVGDFWLAFCA